MLDEDDLDNAIQRDPKMFSSVHATTAQRNLIASVTQFLVGHASDNAQAEPDARSGADGAILVELDRTKLESETMDRQFHESSLCVTRLMAALKGELPQSAPSGPPYTARSRTRSASATQKSPWPPSPMPCGVAKRRATDSGTAKLS